MLVGDIIYNDDFDCNCNYAVFLISEDELSWHDLEPVFSTKRDGYGKPMDWILDLKVSYITINDAFLIIEGIKG